MKKPELTEQRRIIRLFPAGMNINLLWLSSFVQKISHFSEILDIVECRVPDEFAESPMLYLCALLDFFIGMIVKSYNDLLDFIVLCHYVVSFLSAIEFRPFGPVLFVRMRLTRRVIVRARNSTKIVYTM